MFKKIASKNLILDRDLFEENLKIAILDEVVMTHTRPVGGPLHQKLKEKNITFKEEISSNINKIGIEQVKISAIDRENKK